MGVRRDYQDNEQIFILNLSASFFEKYFHSIMTNIWGVTYASDIKIQDLQILSEDFSTNFIFNWN